jgi:hypothetical protein
MDPERPFRSSNSSVTESSNNIDRHFGSGKTYKLPNHNYSALHDLTKNSVLTVIPRHPTLFHNCPSFQKFNRKVKDATVVEAILN